MIAATAHRIARSTKTPAVVVLQRTFTRQAIPAVADGSAAALRYTYTRPAAPSAAFSFVQPQSFRAFSTAIPSTEIPTIPTDASDKGTVTKKLRALDMSVVRQIKAELLEVDANSDGRIDAEELKQLLRRHNSAFTDDEILEIGELFYAGQAGSSVSMERFIEAIDFAAAGEDAHIRENDEKGQHFKETGRHPLGVGRCSMEYMFLKSHGHYTESELDVKLTHIKPSGIRDYLAYGAVKGVRTFFDSITGWRNDNITTHKILQRVIFLETIAAVPGMVAAIVRHFRSLRTMKRDGGMLQMFLEEANNERMHLLTFVRMRDPSTLFRASVIGGQFGFGTFFLIAYMISPKFCHRFVGYVEEEACSTYTKIIQAIEEAPEGSELAEWKTQRAPKIAISYWKLGENGSVLDLMYAVRADEAEHRDVNHLVSGMKEGQINPLYDPQAKLDVMLIKYVKDIMAKGNN